MFHRWKGRVLVLPFGIHFAPQFPLSLCSLSLTLAISLPVLLKSGPRVRGSLGLAPEALDYAAVALSVALLLATALRDPGIIERGGPEEDAIESHGRVTLTCMDNLPTTSLIFDAHFILFLFYFLELCH